MLVTGYPFVLLGMTMDPEKPAYPVMVIAPLLVMKLNCDLAASGSSQSSSNTKKWRGLILTLILMPASSVFAYSESSATSPIGDGLFARFSGCERALMVNLLNTCEKSVEKCRTPNLPRKRDFRTPCFIGSNCVSGILRSTSLNH